MHLPDAEPLSLPGDRLALVRLAQNLIANAARHGGSGGIVEVALTRVGDAAQLTVSDRGPGMTPEELENAFTAFYRGPEARLSRSRGTGLGLSLVDEIVRAHGGSIVLANRTGGGLTATVRLPLALNPGDAT